MPLSSCQYWIFDMDGTLTLPAHDFNAIRRQLGIEPDTPILEAIGKMPADNAMATRKLLHDIEMEIAGAAQAQPGAAKLLQQIRGRGCKLGILTRNDEQIAEATLHASGLLDFFEPGNIVGRETCAPKPLPDGVQYLLNRWSADAGQSVMVGDYLYDMEAGFRAGVQTVHFDSTGCFNWPQFTHYRVTSLSDISHLAGA